MKENRDFNEMHNDNDNQQLIPVKKSNAVPILVVIVILLLAGLIYVLFFTKDDNTKPKEEETHEKGKEPEKEETEEKEKETEEKEEGKEPERQYDLVVYKEKDGGALSSENKAEDYLTKAFTIKVSNKNAKVLSTEYYNRNLVLYDDNGLYIYDSNTKKSQKVNLENTYKEYHIYLNEDNNKVIGIGYIKKDGNYGYYNISKDVKLYDGKYKTESFVQINDHYLYLRHNNMIYLLSTDSEAVKLSFKDEADVASYTSFGSNGDYVYALGESFDVTQYERFYTKDFKKFYEVKDNSIWGGYVSFNNGYLYIYNNNKIMKYNTSGELISTNTDYSNVKQLTNNYIVYLKDNNLVIENMEDTSESKVLTKWDKSWSLDGFEYGYYSRNLLDIYGESNKKEGIYVVIDYGYDEEGNVIKDSKGYYGMEYCYTSDKKVIEYPIKQEKGGRAKPVLYLYPTKEANIKVEFLHPELLTTTYPKYINSWNVKVSPNGDMYDKDGKYYYALYWDEKRYNEVDFKEGFYVEGKNAIKFLEEKLAYIGLSDKERNEFIMYWLPIMENNKKNLVYFELTNEREAGNKLIITPKPDSLLRVSIHIKKVNSKVNIKEQKLETFKRVGFTAVEWGGMTY